MGFYAADGAGRQPCRVVAVVDRAARDELSRLNASFTRHPGRDPFYGAPVVLVVLAPRDDETRVYDGSLVMASLMLAAHARGLGSCWIHRAREEFESPAGAKLLNRWGIEGDWEGIAHCALGYPAGPLPAARPRREGMLTWA